MIDANPSRGQRRGAVPAQWGQYAKAEGGRRGWGGGEEGKEGDQGVGKCDERGALQVLRQGVVEGEVDRHRARGVCLQRARADLGDDLRYVFLCGDRRVFQVDDDEGLVRVL
mgnify:CR=1 FL=1